MGLSPFCLIKCGKGNRQNTHKRLNFPISLTGTLFSRFNDYASVVLVDSCVGRKYNIPMRLKDILKGKVAIVGIGNVMKGDDGFGPALIEELRTKVNAPCIDAGSAPENYVGVIAGESPDTVLLLDAADLGKDPGQYDILEEDEILKSGFTTHDLSAGMFMEYLKKRTGANIYLLGIQPENVSFGNEISGKIKAALPKVAQIIKEALDA